MRHKSMNKGSEPAKNVVAVRGPVRQLESGQEKPASPAEKIRLALGERAETL